MPYSVIGNEQIFIGLKYSQSYIVNLQGRVLRTFSSGKQNGGNFTCATMSHFGKWIYCAGEDGVVYMFDSNTGTLENILEVIKPEKDIEKLIDKNKPEIKQNANSYTIAINKAKAQKEIIGIAHHTQRNIIATITDDGKLTLWKP